MSILDLINATANAQYLYQMYQGLNISPNRQVAGATPKGSAVPSFGLKMRPPLTNDKFEHAQSQGQQMYNYKGKTIPQEQAIVDSEKEVSDHENKHYQVAGEFAASGPVLIKDSNGITVSGYVMMKMPHLDKKNPDKTIKHARQVMAAAKAPESFSELSDADLNVYAKASATLAQAESFKAQQSRNPFAKNPFANRV